MKTSFVGTIRLLAIFLFASAIPAFGQVATGTPPFGSFGGGPDVINLGNLNAHITIPIVNKAGRGTAFNYNLSYDTSVWYPTTVNGALTWQPVYNWGWLAQTAVNTGYVSATQNTYYCYYMQGEIKYVGSIHMVTTNYAYHDQWGVPHSVSGTSNYWLGSGNGGCGLGTDNGVTATTTDGSGLTLNMPDLGAGTVTTRKGTVINAPFTVGTGAASFTDRNGNEITVNSSGVFEDTLGTTALTVSGVAPSNTTFTYTAPSGANATYTMKYASQTVTTSFGCSGITEYSATGVYLVSEIDLPDGTKYAFTYGTDGRLASVSFPTGGSITYSYTGSNNGIECSDGSTAGLNRIVTPGGEWKYSRSGSGTAWTTTVTDATSSANQTLIHFQSSAPAGGGTTNFYETERQIYQGSTSGTLLKTIIRCYNGLTASCNTTAITLPVTQLNVYVEWPGTSGQRFETNLYYNSYGLVTEKDEYAYGAGEPGALARKTLTTYASLGNGIVSMPSNVTVEDGSGNIGGEVSYAYDSGSVITTSGTPQHVSITGSRGNATTINSFYQTGRALVRGYTYYDTGNVSVAADVNAAQTTYTYGSGSCGNSFPTSVAEPLSLSRSMTWNCTGGEGTSVTDENGKTSSLAYTDPYFWRPNSATDQASNTTSLTYTPSAGSNGASVESSLLFGSSSTTDVLLTEDGLGRTLVSQLKESPSSGTYDSVETDYDVVGRNSRTTLPYAAAAGSTNSSAPGTSTVYDTLNRPTEATDSSGGYFTYFYSQNDVMREHGPAPTGENTKTRQFEYDSLGRLLSVCEITSLTGAGSCAQNGYTENGYLTTYSYSVLNRLTGVTQNAQSTSQKQTRTYAYDWLGRMTSETNPEAGNVSYTYTYDTDSTCGTSNGDLVKKVDPLGDVVCYTYDALHRVESIFVNSGSYASSTPYKYFTYDSATVNGVAMSIVKGRLAEAYTCASSACSSKITDIGFSYTARGEVSDVYESTPHSGGYYHVNQTYWANHAPETLSAQYGSSSITGLPTITYGVDGEGRVYSASASSGQNPLSSTTYSTASLPTAVDFGSLDSDAFTYDPNSNRMTKYQFTINGQSVVGALTWNAIGTLETLGVTDPFNSGNAQTCSYSHDDLTRIASTNCGSPWSQTFTYDAFGNISKSGTQSFQPTYSYLTNHMTLIGGSTPSYDANGNVTNDFLHSYAWDANGRPVTADGVGLTYDALGRMVEQNKSGAYYQIVYAPAGAKLMILQQETLEKAFVPLTGGAAAVYSSSGLAYYRHSDWIGSSRFASTPTRTLYYDGAYAPFGEAYAQMGTTDLSFTGMNQDTVANLYDFPVREYGIQGRWPSPDPAGLSSVRPRDPQTLNRYAYVRNSPLQIIDRTGLCGDDDDDDDGDDDDDSTDVMSRGRSITHHGTISSGSGWHRPHANLTCGGHSVGDLCPNGCNTTPPDLPTLGLQYCADPSCGAPTPDDDPDVLNSSAQQILGMLSNVDTNIAEIYGASVAAGGLGWTVVMFGPSITQAGIATLTGLATSPGANDLLNGFTSPQTTPSLEGYVGTVCSFYCPPVDGVPYSGPGITFDWNMLALGILLME